MAASLRRHQGDPFTTILQEEQDELLTKWSELSTLDLDLSLFRPVYAPKDFLEIITQVSSPNLISAAPSNVCATDADDSPDGAAMAGVKPSWGLIAIPLSVPTLEQLREKFCEIARWEKR